MSSMTRGYVVGLMIGHLQHDGRQMQWALANLDRYLTPVLPPRSKGKRNPADPPHLLQYLLGMFNRISITEEEMDTLRRAAVTEAGLDAEEVTRGIADAHASHAEQSRVWQEHLGEEGRQVVWNKITDPPRIPRTPVHLPTEEDAR